MKIFFPIGAFYPSQIGGPCNTVYWHVKELEKHGIESTVVTSMLGITEDKIKSNTGTKSEHVEIYYQGNIISYTTAKLIYENLKTAQILHLNGLFNIPVNISVILWSLFFSRKKVVCSVRGELNPNALKFSRWKKYPSLFLYRLLYKRILFHATSTAEEKDVKNYFPGCKIIQIPNLIYPAEKVLEVKKNKQLLFMGRIHEIKALHKLITALSLSKSFKNSDFILDITGNHEERHQEYFMMLKKMIVDLDLENKVKFSGHLTGLNKETKYAESYFLILPSETENFGNVVVEALNQGTPVLSSLGTPWKVLEEYQCGFHTNNSPENLAQFVDKIIQMDSDTYNEYSANTTKLVNDKFNINTQINRWITIYQNLNNNHANTK